MLYSALITTIFLITQINGFVIDKRQQKDAVKTPKSPPLRSLVWGDINFIHSTDTHGWLEGHILQGSFNGDLGDFYSFCIRMKEKSRILKKDLFIVDTGDTHDGNGLSDATDPKGSVTQPLITNIPYDILTIVDNITLDTVNNFIPHWKDRYLAANVYLKDVNNNKTIQIGNKYTYFQGEFGTRVLAYGFLFNFKGNGKKSVVTFVEEEIAKSWFKESLQAYTPDVITLIGHIDIRSSEFYHIIAAIRTVYPTIPIAILGGHTHIRDFVQYDDYAAGIESGRYMETIGFLSINGVSNSSNSLTFHRRYMDQNRVSYIHHAVDGKKRKFDTHKGKEISKKITKLRKKLMLSQHLGCAPQTYPLYSVLASDESSIFRLITQQVLPKTIADTSRKNFAFFLYNSGGVRFDVYKGSFTKSNMYQLSPFEDNFYRIDNVPLQIARSLLSRLNKSRELKKRLSWPYISDLSYQSILSISKTNFTPGFVTKDDYGTDGDDTLHSPIPFYKPPAYIASDLPADQDDTLVDIYYIEFFQVQLQDALKNLTGNYWNSNKTVSTLTSSTMWIDYAKNYWQDCP